MTLHPYVNLGIAVDLEPAGPRRAGGEGRRPAQHARDRPGDHQDRRRGPLGEGRRWTTCGGSTFTITNPGPFASYASAPIINQPNVGILCTDGVKRRPVAVGDAIAIHPTGVLGLVYDHRAFDGSTASMFLMHIRDSLEKRDWEAEVG